MDYTDTSTGSEIVSWGKQAINADDSYSGGNIVYVIDGHLYPISSELNMVGAGTVNTGDLGVWSIQHAHHVAGIIGAHKNGAVTRGVNPGNSIVTVNRGADISKFWSAMDWAFRDAEDRGIHAVANFSSNTNDLPNQFNRDGALGSFVERASARLFFVQSAGNHGENACLHAYSYRRDADGIMVVGGTNENDQYASVVMGGASNYGSCVEIWAPSTDILSLWYSPYPGPHSLSGTSMAAPHVAALGARFGGWWTTSLQRELAVRQWMTSTGNVDPLGYPVVKPWYSGAASVPDRLLPVASSASSTASGLMPAYAHDGLYADPALVWDSGGPAPAWIEFDLGSVRNLRYIRGFLEQATPDMATHNFYVGTTSPANTLQTFVTSWTSTLSSIVVPMNVSARYVRIHTVATPGSVGWREVEFYGY